MSMSMSSGRLAAEFHHDVLVMFLEPRPAETFVIYFKN